MYTAAKVEQASNNVDHLSQDQFVGGILRHRIYSADKYPEVNLEMVKYECTAGKQSERMYM